MDPRRYGPFPYSAIIDRPALRWPNGARVAVWVIPNIEFFPLNATIPREAAIVPNLIPWTRRDYGNRVGIFRLMEALAKRNIRGTVALNSDICSEHPRIIEAAMDLKWEFMGHCQTNSQLLDGLDPEAEKRAIKTTLDVIGKATGRKPKGWLSAGLSETWHTLEFLSAAGVQYVADWVNDDEPYVMDVGDPKMISIPYTNEINDITVLVREGQTSEEFGQMMRRQFEVLYEEGGRRAKVMAIALHPWVIGVPHRIRPFTAALDFIANHQEVWFATGTEIIDAYRGLHSRRPA
jgi:peptidoglycan/xylan/chitin deacetylase (PgdA/CDA1 family)